LSATLADKVARALSLPAVRLVAAPSGAIHAAYLVHDAAQPDGPPVAFVRAESGESGLSGTESTLLREATLLTRLGTLGFPVAEVLGTVDEPPSIVMNVVPGTSRPSADEVERVAPEYMTLVAKVHALDPVDLPMPQFDTMTEAVGHDLRWWADAADAQGVMDVPLIRLGLRILPATLPQTNGPPAFVHGDIGPGNFMVDDGKVSAMLDWELAHLGDPHEDLAWLWMRGAHTEFGDPRRRIAEYARASGRSVDDGRLWWHLAFVMWKSVIGTHGALRNREVDGGQLLPTVVDLTYQTLLASHLARLVGVSLPCLAEVPRRRVDPVSRLAEFVLSDEGTTLSRSATIAVEYLRDVTAQRAWEERRFLEDALDLLGRPANPAVDEIDDADDPSLPALVVLYGRAADRAAQAMPKAVRRIQRGQAIGLGT
jgi:aminoglycoside phosphotransferase (APT) family kinase protein